MEILFLSIMRRGCEQQKLASVFREFSTEFETLRVFDLRTEIRGGHFVSFVHHDEIPIRGNNFVLDVFLAAKLIEATDAETVFLKPVASPRGLQTFVRKNVELKVE